MNALIIKIFFSYQYIHLQLKQTMFDFLYFVFLSFAAIMMATMINGIMPMIPVGAGPTKGLPPSFSRSGL